MEVISKVESQECLSELLNAGEDDSGVKLISQEVYEGLTRDASRNIVFEGGRFLFSKSAIYTPICKHEDSFDVGVYQNPYCPNNEKYWASYYDENSTNLPWQNTIVCNILSNHKDQIIEITPYFRARVYFKDPYHISHGEPTGYVLGYITTPLIVAITDDRSVLYLTHYSKRFSEILDNIFPTTYVGLARKSELEPQIASYLSALSI